MKTATYSPLDVEDPDLVPQIARLDERSIRRWRTISIVSLAILGVLLLLIAVHQLLVTTGTSSRVDCSASPVRFDCYPEGAATEGLCQARGCCWDDTAGPACFYGPGFGYELDGDVRNTSYGFTANAAWKAGQFAPFDGVVETLRVDVYYVTPYCARVKVGSGTGFARGRTSSCAPCR